LLILKSTTIYRKVETGDSSFEEWVVWGRLAVRSLTGRFKIFLHAQKRISATHEALVKRCEIGCSHGGGKLSLPNSSQPAGEVCGMHENGRKAAVPRRAQAQEPSAADFIYQKVDKVIAFAPDQAYLSINR
jgi:hypothetical protein